MQQLNASYTFEAIGTRWDISLPSDNSEEIISKVKKRVQMFDRNYSRFKNNSLITKISKKKGKYKMPEDFPPLFNVYLKLFRLTNGEFTPLIGNVLDSLGYDKNYSFIPNQAVKPEKFDKVVIFKNGILEVKKPVLLDFGAGGKGYLIDIISSIFKKHKVKEFLIDAGGDIVHFSSKKNSVKVGLENPANAKQVIGTVNISNESICGSSGNRRKWKEYHHIVSPSSLKSESKVLSTWVVAKNALTADSLATAIFLTKNGKICKAFNAKYFILYNDYTFDKGDNFDAELFLR